MPNPRPWAVCDLSVKVAGRIREIRTERSWPQALLASRAGVAPATVTVVERHQRNPTLPLLERFAAALGEDPAVFFQSGDPVCGHCGDRPRPGFTCNLCDLSAPFLNHPAEVVA